MELMYLLSKSICYGSNSLLKSPSADVGLIFQIKMVSIQGYYIEFEYKTSYCGARAIENQSYKIWFRYVLP